VGTKREIHELVRNLASQQVAVLLVSSDLPELLLLSQRVVVMRQGKIVTEFQQPTATADAVLRAMAGIGAAPR
jgi:rhamnose transport system ATP-binding protein